MRLKSLREELVCYGKRMFDSGLVVGTGGNISALDRESGIVAITPSGRNYLDLTPEDIILLTADGTYVEGNGKASSEWRMHTIFYRNRGDINGLVHTHSPKATAISCMERQLPAIHYLIAATGGAVPCAPYRTFGTEELARAAFESMKNRRAVLLARHGLLAGAHKLSKAFDIASHVEYIAGLYLDTLSVGVDPTPLPKDELERLNEAFASYRPE